MTPHQLSTEREYRIQERLGILCGNQPPTPEQLTLATREAEMWESRCMLSRILDQRHQPSATELLNGTTQVK